MKFLKRIFWFFLVLFVFVVVAYAIAVLINPRHISGLVKQNLVKPDFHYKPWIYILLAHIITAIVAISVGPVQFIMKRKRNSLHKYLGMSYVGSIIISGLVSFYLSIFSNGGVVAHLGFFCLDALWIFTTVMAYLKIKQKQIVEHKQWMMRSYALTLGAVTLRLYLSPLIALIGNFDTAYRIVSWIAWVPNIVIIESVIRHSLKKHTKTIDITS